MEIKVIYVWSTSLYKQPVAILVKDAQASKKAVVLLITNKVKYTGI